MNNTCEKIHFIGIGGVGMSGIAKVAKSQGLSVSGSDMKSSRYTDQLKDCDVEVFIGHAPTNIPEGEPTIVVSTAILDNNVELIEAKSRGLNIIHRAEMLAILGRNLKTLAVAGTHGKTTTSSMLAYIVDELGLDPTFLIGGTVRKYMTNAKSGQGQFYVVEADESDKSFVHLNPFAAIITNIEADHLDHYVDMDEIYANFKAFMDRVGADNPLVVCGDDEKLVELASDAHPANTFTYGFSDSCDYKVTRWKQNGVGSIFSMQLPSGQVIESSIKQNPGAHNVLNAAGVLALVDALGLDVHLAALRMSEFCGVKRRFDLVGTEKNITVVDDYAHHPTEIAATIKAASELDFNNVHVLFQPHRYSRAPLFTQVLRDEFAHAFDNADTVTFMDVYPAGETPVPGVNGKTFMNVLSDSANCPPAQYVPRRFDVPAAVASKANAGDIIITMGAGDVTEFGHQILDAISSCVTCAD